MRTFRVDPDVYRELLRRKAAIEEREQRIVSMSDVVRELLEEQKPTEQGEEPDAENS